MKYPIKTIFQNLFIVVLALSATTSFAQRRFDPDRDSERFFRFGAKGGVNINKINGQSYKDGFNYNYLVGGFMQFNFSRRFCRLPRNSATCN